MEISKSTGTSESTGISDSTWISWSTGISECHLTPDSSLCIRITGSTFACTPQVTSNSSRSSILPFPPRIGGPTGAVLSIESARNEQQGPSGSISFPASFPLPALSLSQHILSLPLRLLPLRSFSPFSLIPQLPLFRSVSIPPSPFTLSLPVCFSLSP